MAKEEPQQIFQKVLFSIAPRRKFKQPTCKTKSGIEEELFERRFGKFGEEFWVNK